MGNLAGPMIGQFLSLLPAVAAFGFVGVILLHHTLVRELIPARITRPIRSDLTSDAR